MKQRALKTSEQGFILATSLVMLVLLTMLSIATYYGTIISQQTSASAQESTQSFYYAETGLNYVAWALKNDAEFDAYPYNTATKEPILRKDPYGNVILNSIVVGDRREWEANKGNPSNHQMIHTTFTTGAPKDIYGQLGYFDNRSLNQRPVGLIQITAGGVTNVYTTAFGVYYDSVKKSRVSPVFHDIYAQLSGYIRLDIKLDGTITPSFSPYGKHEKMSNGKLMADVPDKGAIVWLTAGDPYSDFQLSPVDTFAAPMLDKYSSPLASTSLHINGSTAWASNPLNPDVWGRTVNVNQTLTPTSYYMALACDVYTYTNANIACEQAMDVATGKPIVGIGQWLTKKQYGLVVYAIGYSGGKARKMIRMVIN